MTPAQKAAIAKAREQQAIARDVRLGAYMAALRKLADARTAMLDAFDALAGCATEREPIIEEFTATGTQMRQVLRDRGLQA